MKDVEHENSIEHVKSMIDSFPDYPCAKCAVMCRSINKCEYWKSWFTRHWNEIRKELIKRESQLR